MVVSPLLNAGLMCFSSSRINLFYCFLNNLKFKKFLLILPKWLKFTSVLFSPLLIWKFYAFHSLGSYYLLLEAVITFFYTSQTKTWLISSSAYQIWNLWYFYLHSIVTLTHKSLGFWEDDLILNCQNFPLKVNLFSFKNLYL